MIYLNLKQKTFFLLVFICFITEPSFSQVSTEEQLHDRYWAYREQFRKYFTIISEDPGGGIAFTELLHQDWLHAREYDPISGEIVDPSSLNPNTKGKLSIGGDPVAFMAEYMGVLSSEYWLLKNTGMSG